MRAAAFLTAASAPCPAMARSPAVAAPAMSARPPATARTPVAAAARATKWAVAAAAGGGLLAAHDAPALLVVGGALANAAATKALKRALRAPRPAAAAAQGKGGAGMPSSHASSLAFFAAAGCALVGGVPAAAGVAAGMVAASWRVGAGLHTWPQVVAGWLWGSATGTAWTRWGMPACRPAMEEAMKVVGPWTLTGVVAVVGVGLVLAKDVLEVLRLARAGREGKSD